MSPVTPRQLLTDQHRAIDRGVLGIVQGNGQLTALAESLALLRLHIYIEEAFLFPPLEEAGVTMPVFVMKREHGEMWPLLNTLIEACESAATIDTLQDTARALFQRLQVHNTKEEEVVYAAVDRLMAQGADRSLAPALETTRVPGNWVCAAMSH